MTNARVGTGATRARRSGFTIIELLIAVGLMVVLTGIAVFVFTQAVNIFIRTDAAAKIYQNARAGLRILERELKEAQPILTADDQKNDVVFRIVSGFTTPGTTPPAVGPGFYDMIEVKTSTRNSAGTPVTTQVRYCVKPIAGTNFGVLKRLVNNGGVWEEHTICQYVDYFLVEFKVADTSDAMVGRNRGRWYHPSGTTVAGGIVPNNYGVGAGRAQQKDATTGTVSNDPTGFWFANVNVTAGTPAVPAMPAGYNVAGSLPGVMIDSTSTPLFDMGPAPSEIRITLGVRDDHSHERRIIHRNIMLPLSR